MFFRINSSLRTQSIEVGERCGQSFSLDLVITALLRPTLSPISHSLEVFTAIEDSARATRPRDSASSVDPRHALRAIFVEVCAFRIAFEGLAVQQADCDAPARACSSRFRIQVVQSPHLRDQLCQVIDADEDIMASALLIS
jgi:hypothetical protein